MRGRVSCFGLSHFSQHRHPVVRLCDHSHHRSTVASPHPVCPRHAAFSSSQSRERLPPLSLTIAQIAGRMLELMPRSRSEFPLAS